MEWDVVAPMFAVVVLILTVGGVVLLRPLSSRLGDLIEVMTDERRGDPDVEETLARIRGSLDALESRLALLEERQDFTDELMRGREGEKRLRGVGDG